MPDSFIHEYFVKSSLLWNIDIHTCAHVGECEYEYECTRLVLCVNIQPFIDFFSRFYLCATNKYAYVDRLLNITVFFYLRKYVYLGVCILYLWTCIMECMLRKFFLVGLVCWVHYQVLCSFHHVRVDLPIIYRSFFRRHCTFKQNFLA